MKSLIEYLTEALIVESGNAIKGVSKIPVRDALDIYNTLTRIISVKHPEIKMCPLGSFGKKKEDQTHGDIDIAIECESFDKVREMVEDVFTPLVGKQVSEINWHTTPNIISLGWIFGGNKIAQVDLMGSKSLEWSQFRYDSPNYIKDESSYKGAVRNMLMQAIIACLPVKGQHIEYFEDGVSVKSKYKYTLNDNGVYKQVLSFAGKNGKPLKNPRKVKELEALLTRSPAEVVQLVFGGNATRETFNSAEALWVAIHDEHKFPYSKEVLDEIEDRFENEYLSVAGISLTDFKNIVKQRYGR